VIGLQKQKSNKSIKKQEQKQNNPTKKATKEGQTMGKRYGEMEDASLFIILLFLANPTFSICTHTY